MNNPNTGKPWVGDEDYCWEDPNRTFHGLRNPRADFNRILFFPESQGVLVCWVNTQEHFGVSKYVNNKRYMDHGEARHLWGCLTQWSHPNKMYIPDNSVPPRMVQPKHPDSGWGKIPMYSESYKSKTNYALEA